MTARAPGRAPVVWSVSMVRNEADIVETFVRHNLAFLDGMAIIDHGSLDATLPILRSLAAEGLPLLLIESAATGYLQGPLTTAVARRVLERAGADVVLPLDADEFVKSPGRGALRRALAAIPPGMHGLLPWLTYVPDFASPAVDIPARIAGARRRARERQVFLKAVITRAILGTPTAVLGDGNHYVAAVEGQALEDAPPHARVRAEHAAIAHLPIRSADQLVAKVAVKRLARLAARTAWQPDAASQVAYDAVVAGAELDVPTLARHAVNWSVPRAHWEAVADVPLVDDPFLVPVALRYTPPRPAAPLPLAAGAVERMVRRVARARAELRPGAAR